MNNNKNGFTLIEIIFSVAFLSVISVIILKLLVVSYELEQATDLMDIATLHAMNEIENVKSITELEDIESYEKFYDEIWNETKEENATYQLSLSMDLNDQYDRGLYEIQSIVTDLIENDVVVNISTHHYYPLKE